MIEDAYLIPSLLMHKRHQHGEQYGKYLGGVDNEYTPEQFRVICFIQLHQFNGGI